MPCDSGAGKGKYLLPRGYRIQRLVQSGRQLRPRGASKPRVAEVDEGSPKSNQQQRCSFQETMCSVVSGCQSASGR